MAYDTDSDWFGDLIRVGGQNYGYDDASRLLRYETWTTAGTNLRENQLRKKMEESREWLGARGQDFMREQRRDGTLLSIFDEMERDSPPQNRFRLVFKRCV